MIFKSLKNSPLFFGGLSTALMLCLSPAAQAQTQPPADYVTVSGNASYLQRIAMPPGAVLTVQVQDVSRADVAATVLAESREAFGRRQVPLAYSVLVPRSAINPRMRYSVRATISVDGQTQFATARDYPVLTQRAPNRVNLLLAAVPEVAHPAGASVATAAPVPALAPAPAYTPSPAASSAPASGFVLPATFAGVLPCAGCRGIAYTVTMQADGSYRLRRTYLGTTASQLKPMAEAGRWTADHQGKLIALMSGSATPSFFRLTTEGALRQLDDQGQPLKSSANHELRRTAKIDPVNEAVTEAVNEASAASPATATLRDTYWKLVELGGQPVAMQPGQEREVRITLASEDQRLMGFSGCNALGGAYALNGNALKFDQLASAMRLCAPALNTLERQVLDALIATTGQRIDGQRLSLLVGDRVLARFEAVYLK